MNNFSSDAPNRVNSDLQVATPAAASLKPDLATMRQHVGAIVQPYASGQIEIVGFPEVRGGPVQPRHFDVAAVEAMISHATEINVNEGVNVYVSPARREGAPANGRANADHVVGTRWIWLDYDEPGTAEAAAAMFEGANMAPTFKVTTGAIPHLRQQFWFLLADEVSGNQVRDVIGRLIETTSADPAPKDPPRVMRIAGSLAWPKPKPGRVLEMTLLSEITDRAAGYHLEEFDRLAPQRDVVDLISTRQQLEGAFQFDRRGSIDTQADVLAALRDNPNDTTEDDWARICRALKHHIGDSALPEFVAFSRKWSRKAYCEGDAEAKWRASKPDGSITLATVFHIVGQPMRDAGGRTIAVNSVEGVAPLLDDLAERAAADPGAPFHPEMLEQLAALKAEDRPTFEALRAQLKLAGCRVTALDDAIAEVSGGTTRRATQADILIDLTGAAGLFHAPDGTALADIEVAGHRETWPVRTKGFRRWLARRFYEETGGAPSSEAMQSALGVVEARAHYDNPERQVFVRVGGHGGTFYLDLADDAWRAVEIDATGWRVVDKPLVRFRRAAGMTPLPIPAPGGSVEALRPFLNVGSDDDFVLVVSWLLAALRDRGPYPLIVLSGEQGSAKSTFASILRAIIDPNSAPLRALPREDRDLFIAASNGHALTFDNVSGLPGWISDTLCRLSTGGGFAVRQLYSDNEETLFDATRPIVLNGIEDFVTRPDLADRALFLTLEPIPEERRRPEAELWRDFEAECPRILGALLDAVVVGIQRLPDVHLPRMPRMADFAMWATACETACWPAGTFGDAYNDNREEAVSDVIDADPIAAAVRDMMAGRSEWMGTATTLLGDLTEVAGERTAKSKAWPGSPRALSGRLRRAATFLRKIGVKIDHAKEGRARARTIHITTALADGADAKKPDPSGRPFFSGRGAGDATDRSSPEPDWVGKFASAPSAPSAGEGKGNGANSLAHAGMQTQMPAADGRAVRADANTLCADRTEKPTVRTNPLNLKGADGADGRDAKIPSYSGPEKDDLPDDDEDWEDFR